MIHRTNPVRLRILRQPLCSSLESFLDHFEKHPEADMKRQRINPNSAGTARLFSVLRQGGGLHDWKLLITALIEVRELCELLHEGKLEFAGRTVALLFDDDLGDISAVCHLVTRIFAVDEQHDVGILLDRA
jgi:hypothetical protein